MTYKNQQQTYKKKQNINELYILSIFSQTLTIIKANTRYYFDNFAETVRLFKVKMKFV